jgi:hypothetical protein
MLIHFDWELGDRAEQNTTAAEMQRGASKDQ